MIRARLAQHRKNEQGQVLLLGLFVVVGLTMVAITVANVGIMVAEKIHLQDTVDAAAYSAAVVEARYMNLSAYVNRAMVANYNSMAFNTAVWAVFDADDHGIAVVTAILYLLSIVATIIGLGQAVDTVADLLRDFVHSPLHEVHGVMYEMFSQEKQDLNQYIEMYNVDILTMYQGILYAAAQSARHEIQQEVAKKMDPDVVTTTVLGLGAEAVSYDELARAVDFVIRDVNARSGVFSSFNESFNDMMGEEEDQTDHPVLLAAVTEASLDRFVAGRDREGDLDGLRNFGTGNIIGWASDAMEFIIDTACEILTLGFGSCDSSVSLNLGASIRDGYEDRANQTHVPVMARRRMREVEMFGLNLEASVNISEAIEFDLGLLGDFVGTGNHTSGEKKNDVANYANLADVINDFDIERAIQCILTGCSYNKMNATMAELMPASYLIPPLFVDDHWDGIWDSKPVNWAEIYPPGSGQLEAEEYLWSDVAGNGFDLYDGVPKYDWQVDLDNVGIPHYYYDPENAPQRPDGITRATNDNRLAGPSIAVVGTKAAERLGGLRGLGIGNDYSPTALARAQVYYLKNPKRPEEKPSLFNPHWVARLAPIDSEDTPPLLRDGLPFVASMGVPIKPTH